MENKFCSKCGASLANDDAFCSKCGSQVIFEKGENSFSTNDSSQNNFDEAKTDVDVDLKTRWNELKKLLKSLSAF